MILVFMVLMAFIALGVDYGAVASARAELQIAADAAAMAGASGLPNEAIAKERAMAYSEQVSIRGTPITLADSDIVVGSYDRTAKVFTEGVTASSDALVVTARRELDMPISSLFGYPTVNLTAVAGGGATTLGKMPDLVIVQDVTTSFTDEIERAKLADEALVDCIHEKADPDSKVGLVAFSGLEKNLLAPSGLVSYASSYSAVKSKIQAIKLCGHTGMPSCLGTDQAAGFHMGKAILDASTSDVDVGRALLLVSDGAPTGDASVCTKKKGAYSTAAAAALCPGWGNSPTIPKIKASTIALRNAMEAKGYDIYTVFYNETSDATQTSFMKTLTAGKGIYLETPDPDDLSDLLTQICHAYTSEHPGLLF
ncbi:hypothetical protein LBMAG42_13780 [Deltaproteobacteria bacterium]|nr:hypothetical protein LBMAG42_13780 [Deltaproteobacteria bacterium]